MKISSLSTVKELYEDTADSYSSMMDSEIALPVYADTLGRLAQRSAAVAGPIVDTSCGSGHMLSMYRESYDPARDLVGIDLSPRMVAIASARLGAAAQVLVGDMRALSEIPTGSVAAVLSFFAIHHLDPEGVEVALQEWNRLLRSGGQLVLAAWEGSGPIDYGDASDVVALQYTQADITRWVEGTGYSVDRCVVEVVEEMHLRALYLEGTRK